MSATTEQKDTHEHYWTPTITDIGEMKSFIDMSGIPVKCECGATGMEMWECHGVENIKLNSK